MDFVNMCINENKFHLYVSSKFFILPQICDPYSVRYLGICWSH